MNYMVIEEKGEELISQFGLTKAEFARRMGIQRQNVKALFKSPKLDTIRRIAEALDVDVMYLLGYTKPIDFDEEPFVSTISKISLEIKPEDVPSGDTVKDRRERQKLIRRFYQQWFDSHQDACEYNLSLKDSIHVAYISVHETSGQASLNYLSTLAVLQLETILREAVVIGETEVKKNNKSQKPFSHMLMMRHNLPGIGSVKMVVGVRRADEAKVQYCVTALQPDR